MCGTLREVLEIVERCPKRRFSVKDVGGQLVIRANQGHSRSIGDMIDSECIMQRIEEPNVFHGSYKRHLESIRTFGLDRRSRKHVHLSRSLYSISGRRHDCDLLVYVDMRSAMNDGILFYESSNGVILTEGFDGIIPPQYLTFQLI